VCVLDVLIQSNADLMYTKDGYEQVFFRAKNFTFEAAAIAL
jgi:hypothetical protein